MARDIGQGSLILARAPGFFAFWRAEKVDIKRGPKFRLYGEKTKQMRVPISREGEVRNYLHGTRGLREMLKDVRAELDAIERAIEPPKAG